MIHSNLSRVNARPEMQDAKVVGGRILLQNLRCNRNPIPYLEQQLVIQCEVDQIPARFFINRRCSYIETKKVVRNLFLSPLCVYFSLQFLLQFNVQNERTEQLLITVTIFSFVIDTIRPCQKLSQVGYLTARSASVCLLCCQNRTYSCNMLCCQPLVM